MNFTVRVKNPPANSVGWEGRWYVPGYYTTLAPFVLNDASFTFTDVPAGPGRFYIRFSSTFPEEGEAWITPLLSVPLAPEDGSYWEYDYASRTIRQVSAPPSAPEVRSLEVSYARA